MYSNLIGEICLELVDGACVHAVLGAVLGGIEAVAAAQGPLVVDVVGRTCGDSAAQTPGIGHAVGEPVHYHFRIVAHSIVIHAGFGKYGGLGGHGVVDAHTSQSAQVLGGAYLHIGGGIIALGVVLQPGKGAHTALVGNAADVAHAGIQLQAVLLHIVCGQFALGLAHCGSEVYRQDSLSSQHPLGGAAVNGCVLAFLVKGGGVERRNLAPVVTQRCADAAAAGKLMLGPDGGTVDVVVSPGCIAAGINFGELAIGCAPGNGATGGQGGAHHVAFLVAARAGAGIEHHGIRAATPQGAGERLAALLHAPGGSTQHIRQRIAPYEDILQQRDDCLAVYNGDFGIRSDDVEGDGRSGCSSLVCIAVSLLKCLVEQDELLTCFEILSALTIERNCIEIGKRCFFG